MDTSDPDKQLVRGTPTGQHNFAIGEPYFLYPYIEPWMGNWLVAGMCPYPPYAGCPNLLAELKARHPDTEVVVTNGAKQALFAAVYALRKRYPRSSGLYHRGPHWPTFPTIAALSGLCFDKLYLEGDIRINASPNNPDGSICDEETDIWDAAYAHPMYGWDSKNTPKHIISVWSASKLLGLSGLRIGWLLTQDKELAGFAADYVEKTTSGVNVEAQGYVAEILNRMRFSDKVVEYDYKQARQVLLQNADTFNQFIAPHCKVSLGLPHNHQGMFAWFSPVNPIHFREALNKTNILLVSGKACGGTDDWWRMTLGNDPIYTKTQLNLLAQKLER